MKILHHCISESTNEVKNHFLDRLHWAVCGQVKHKPSCKGLPCVLWFPGTLGSPPTPNCRATTETHCWHWAYKHVPWAEPTDHTAELLGELRTTQQKGQTAPHPSTTTWETHGPELSLSLCTHSTYSKDSQSRESQELLSWDFLGVVQFNSSFLSTIN